MVVETQKTNEISSRSISVKFVAVPQVWEHPVLEQNFLNSSIKWVRFGKMNKFPAEVLDVFQKAGLNQAIIRRKVNMMMGEGLSYDSDNAAQERRMDKFMANPNPYEDMDTLVRKLVLDYTLFGGYYVQVIWQRGGKGIAELYHMPFDRVRSGKKNNKGIVDKYYFILEGVEWVSANAKSDVTELDAFNTDARKGKPQVYAVFEQSPVNPYYPLPDYSAAMVDLNTYIDISVFHNANIKNNFAPGMLIFFRGPEPSEEEKDDIVTRLREKYSGSGNAGKPAIFFLDSEQTDPVIQSADNSENAQMFESLSKSIRENIVTSHQIPGALAAIPQPGTLGNSKELLEAEMLFMDDYIKPHQAFFMNGFNRLLAVNKLPELSFLNPNPSIMMFGMGELKEVLTIDEIREYLGYGSMESAVVDPEPAGEVEVKVDPTEETEKIA